MNALVLLMAIASGGIAAPVLPIGLTFDNLKPGEQVLGYYDGGFGSLGSGPGPLAGITFTTGLAADATTIAFGQSALITGSSVTMNLDTPWSGIISFYFEGNGSLSFYSGLDGTGTLLHLYTLSYPPFFPFGASPGSFQSAVFTPSAPNTFRIDSLTFGATVIPEPQPALLLMTGAIAIAAVWRIRLGTPVRRALSE